MCSNIARKYNDANTAGFELGEGRALRAAARVRKTPAAVANTVIPSFISAEDAPGVDVRAACTEAAVFNLPGRPRSLQASTREKSGTSSEPFELVHAAISPKRGMRSMLQRIG